MLILSRRKAQTIHVGSAVIHIRDCYGTVSIGIDAPKDVPVLRGELLDKDKPHTHADSRWRPEFDDGHGPNDEDLSFNKTDHDPGETGILPPDEKAA